MNNTVRIIGGHWRSRQIKFDNIAGLRPTPTRVRETLFNWLHCDVIASVCLDLYAGSGALGFEAASRGAQQVVQVEQHPLVCQQLKTNAIRLKATQIQAIEDNALHFLETNNSQFDLIFIDPPFHKALAIRSCQKLEQHARLATTAKIYIEVERRLSLQGLPSNWQCLKAKSAGEIDYYLFQRQ
jgi:16S rRNA (guanine966-N2)-methyltransferase